MIGRRGFAALCCGLAVGGVSGGPLDAQVAEVAAWPSSTNVAPFRQAGPSPDPGIAALLSFGLPGAGQHVLGQRRKWVYLAAEVLGWALYLDRRGAGADLREGYRTLAWDQARVQSGQRIDGNFAYYETLTKWTRSGGFDTDQVAAGLQPEQDPTTFNGAVWALASQIFIPPGPPVPPGSPAYASALEYYRDRAYGEAFLWDWSGAPGAQQSFASLISASDERYRQATTALGLVIANHLVSAADAFLSSRGAQPPARVRLVPARRPGPGWRAVLSVPLPR